ncbi:GNAT family N-acetyltransferase [Flavobacterium collinsii]|uniref:GNAT family N-acetyltransferase n=1 Tax=Flavobacterium collinsii TaxID=1114861 RepID=UPI00375645E6
MEVRLAEPKDIKQILPLFIELDNKHSSNNRDLRTRIPKERYNMIFQDVFKTDSNLIVSVVELEEKIIGFAMGKLLRIQNNLILNNQVIGEVLYIMIDANSKRKGIGRLLMNDIEERLIDGGANKLELRVFSFNDEPLPEKIGYRPKYTVYEKY